ncbi:MAG: carboxypeptidase-like regulatory domain-containing protein [Planctomycetota bacterium]
MHKESTPSPPLISLALLIGLVASVVGLYLVGRALLVVAPAPLQAPTQPPPAVALPAKEPGERPRAATPPTPQVSRSRVTPAARVTARLHGLEGAAGAWRLAVTRRLPEGVSETILETTGRTPRLDPLTLPSATRLALRLTHPQLAPFLLEDLVLLPGELRDLGVLDVAVAHHLRGIVRGPDGSCAPDAVLTARREATRGLVREPERLIEARARTDSAGHFEIGPCGAEPIDLAVDYPGAPLIEWLGLQPWPVGSEGSPVELNLGNASGVSGLVLDADGVPLEGARVTATALQGDRLCRQETSTTQDGNFNLNRLEEGFYVVEAQAPGFLPCTKTQISTGVFTLRCRLQRAGRLEGRVVDAATQEPAAHFELQLFASSSSARDAPPRPNGSSYWFASPDGSFMVPEIPPGSYWTRARALNRYSSMAGPIEMTGAATVRVEPLLLRPVARLQARVTSPEGEGVPSWAIAVPPEWRNLALLERPPLLHGTLEGFSSSDGDLMVEGSPPGHVRLLVRAAGYAPLLTDVLDIGAPATYELGTITLQRAASVRGRVSLSRLAQRGTVVVELVLLDQQTTFSATAGANGHYALERIPPGAYRLRVYVSDPEATSLEWGPRHERPLTLMPGEEKELLLDL